MRTRGTGRNRNEDLETRKKRTAEHTLGESLAVGVQTLNDEPATTAFLQSVPSISIESEGMDSPVREPHQHSASPLNTILERYANFEKVIEFFMN